MSEDWLGRWHEGRTGWHEPGGNEGLRSFWPSTAAARRVLVPLCGKSPDLLWLAKGGNEVVGVDLAEIAVRGFFEDNDLAFSHAAEGALQRFTADDLRLTIYCGDYFDLDIGSFDALYDRGALVALPPDVRPRYVEHTKRLLEPVATKLIVTLEYDQSVVAGPPFAVMAEEMLGYWSELERVSEKDDLETCPPKFRQAGLREIAEVFWLAEA